MNEAKKTNSRRISRIRRSRKAILVGAERPRMLIFRSNRHVYAQIIDLSGRVLAAASSHTVTGAKTKGDVAVAVGTKIAEIAIAKKVQNVVLDRRGYKYHGRVKALADAARAGGLVF